MFITDSCIVCRLTVARHQYRRNGTAQTSHKPASRHSCRSISGFADSQESSSPLGQFTRPDSQPHHRDAGLASAGPLSSRHIAVAALIEGFAGIARIHSVPDTPADVVFSGVVWVADSGTSLGLPLHHCRRAKCRYAPNVRANDGNKKRMACHVISAEAMRFSKQSATVIRFEILRKYAPRVAAR